MIKIGCHVSMNNPHFLLGSVNEALSYGANTFMFYTGAPQNSVRTPLEALHINEARNYMKEQGLDIKNVVVHAPYLINLANLNKEKSAVSYNLLETEVKRTLAIGCHLLVLHPGASLDFDRNESLNQIAFYLNSIISCYPKITILLETMAGKGSEVGYNFEEIAYIINLINHKESIGVCLDTCHINDAGYNIADTDDIVSEFDRIIGLKYLKVIHVNDSKNPRGSHKDRHENIGYGTIGFDNLINLIYHESLKDKIFILETPYCIYENDRKANFPPYKFEIKSIIEKKFNPNLYSDIFNYYKGQ